jgi:hypothetical protein
MGDQRDSGERAKSLQASRAPSAADACQAPLPLHTVPLLLLRAVCYLLVPAQLALPLSQVKLAKADVCDSAVLLSLEAVLAGDAVRALVALTLPRLPDRAHLFVAPSPARRRGASVAFGALPPRGRAACAAPSRPRSSAPSPSSRSWSSIGLAAPPDRRARLERGIDQRRFMGYASCCSIFRGCAAPTRDTAPSARRRVPRAEHSAHAESGDTRDISGDRGISRAYQPDMAERISLIQTLIRV